MRIALKEWMDETGRTPESLAKELRRRGLKAGKSMVRAVMADEKRFGLDTIFVLQKISKGKVNFNNLFVPLSELPKAAGE